MPDIGPVSVTLLGTGTSTGVPVIGCTCRVCTSDDPRDARTRTACWIRVNGISIIIDTGPDFRQQALRERLDHVDAVLYTPPHFDHVVGIDDPPPFLSETSGAIPCHAPHDPAEALPSTFRSLFPGGA